MNKKNTQPKNALKAYKPASTAKFTLVPAEKREEINWQSHYYRQKALEFNNSASFEASTPAVVAMSNNINWDDEDDDIDDTDTYSNDGGDLLKKLRKAKRADEKRIKELTEQLEGLSKVQRERTVKEVLSKWNGK